MILGRTDHLEGEGQEDGLGSKQHFASSHSSGEEVWRVTDVLGTELPLTPPHDHPKATLPALTDIGVRCVWATPLLSELCFGSRLCLSGPRCGASTEGRGMVGKRCSLNEAPR